MMMNLEKNTERLIHINRHNSGDKRVSSDGAKSPYRLSLENRLQSVPENREVRGNIENIEK